MNLEGGRSQDGAQSALAALSEFPGGVWRCVAM